MPGKGLMLALLDVVGAVLLGIALAIPVILTVIAITRGPTVELVLGILVTTGMLAWGLQEYYRGLRE